MRFPSLKSRKSSNGPSTGTSTAVASTDEQLRSQASGGSSLSRWKSGISSVDEHGVLTSTAASPSAPASTSTSSAATAPSGKRSFFRRKSHSRSQSAGSQGMLDGTHTQSDSHPHATAPNGGHPLRQLTLPSELESTPHRSKRPGLSFSKRGFTATDVLSTHSRDAPRKSTGSASYGPSSPQSYSETLDARPPSRTNELSASSSSESFQLKSFRSVTAVREEPTLSSLVDAELTHSPISTRPSSPSAVPHTSLSTSSYFDSRPTSTASTTRVPSTPSGSISVSRFREAKAARSNSSLNSNASHTTAQRQTSGLKLDLPPRISLEYSPRPSLSIVQPDTQERPTSRPTSPLNDADGGPLSRASSSSPSHESYTTALHTLHASPPRVASPSIMQRSLSPSIVSHDERQPVVHPLAMHPDNALPLPPVPVDPWQQPRQHRRSQSGQSISSLSASLGGWFNSTSANLGISFSADDVHKAFAEKAAALRSRTPSIKDGIGLHSDSPKQGKLSQPQPEEEIIASPAESGPTREELAILLGGKILPPPPSATGDDYDPRSELVKPTSPKTPLSRASSFSNLGFGSNLFTNALTRIARPAQDDDQDSEDSHDVPVAKAAPVKVPSKVRKHARAGNAFDTSSTSSDQDNEEEEVDSDDSEAQKRERERSLVFPPPRPTDEADRQRIYRAALTPPVLTPQGSSSDLRAYAQVCELLLC